MTYDYPKILLACPVSSAKDYCLWEWIERVKYLSYPNLDIFLADNSYGPGYAETIRNEGVNCEHYRRPAAVDTRYLLLDSWSMIRKKVLEGGYDYHFSLECDLFPPYDIVEQLLSHATAHGLPVVAAPFMIRQGEQSELMVQQMGQIANHRMQMLVGQFPGYTMIGTGLQQVVNPGQGCVLIHRSVYEQVQYTIQEPGDAHPDSYFFYELWEKGIPVYLDTSLVVEHKNRSWKMVS